MLMVTEVFSGYEAQIVQPTEFANIRLTLRYFGRYSQV